MYIYKEQVRGQAVQSMAVISQRKLSNILQMQ